MNNTYVYFKYGKYVRLIKTEKYNFFEKLNTFK